ncbi:hypothetical protein UR09_04125 [Candidatus Nitromaritima sp. SCGC AAA799-A02]|nr:hypothetical protein UR09_04125 [Candidatus Nitromaritima sp. SCGC AAA799-A02]
MGNVFRERKNPYLTSSSRNSQLKPSYKGFRPEKQRSQQFTSLIIRPFRDKARFFFQFVMKKI